VEPERKKCVSRKAGLAGVRLSEDETKQKTMFGDQERRFARLLSRECLLRSRTRRPAVTSIHENVTLKSLAEDSDACQNRIFAELLQACRNRVRWVGQRAAYPLYVLYQASQRHSVTTGREIQIRPEERFGNVCR